MIFICQIQNILFLVSQLEGHVGPGHIGIHQKEKALTSKPSRSKDGQQTLYEWKNNYVVIAENRSVSIMKNLFYNYNQLY